MTDYESYLAFDKLSNSLVEYISIKLTLEGVKFRQTECLHIPKSEKGLSYDGWWKDVSIHQQSKFEFKDE